MIHILLSLSLFSSAQSPVYNWDTCIDMATQNNADILAGAANVKATKALEGVPRATFLPQVTLNMGGNRTDTNLEGALTATTPVEGYYAAASASYNVFSGFRDYGNLRQAKYNTAAVEANLRIIKARISFELKSSYQSLMYAKEFNKLTQDIIRRRQDNMRLVELRYENGRENKGSLLLARAYYTQAQYDDLVARNSQHSARANLARSIGIDEATDFDIDGEIPTKTPPERGNMQTLATKTPEHQQAVAQAEAADYGVVASRSAFLPSVDLSAEVRKTDTHLFPEMRENWSVGFNVSYPLFRGFGDVSRIRSASAVAGQAFVNRVSIDRQLLSKVTNAYNSFVEAVARFELNRAFKDATQVRAEIARNKYNNGLLTFEDWDVIESDLINRQKDFLSSLRDRTIAEAAWEQALGEGVIQ